MDRVDRMFRVIVAGGIALAATAPGLVAGCGGSVATTGGGDGGGTDAFPQEGPAQADAFPQETGAFVDVYVESSADAFPQEGPPLPPDSGTDAPLVDTGSDGFPHEGPNIEAGFFDTSVPEAGQD
ncbi:MAG TPA: hypothetical protein VIF15_07875 [Polyangiaceae bacterium]|jgi:hypothetical protein